MQEDANAEDAMEKGIAMTAVATAAGVPAPAIELLQEEEQVQEGPCGARTLKTRIAQGVAIASFVLNLLAMIWEQSAVAIVAGIIACVIAPVVVYRQFQMQNTDCTFVLCHSTLQNVHRLPTRIFAFFYILYS